VTVGVRDGVVVLPLLVDDDVAVAVAGKVAVGVGGFVADVNEADIVSDAVTDGETVIEASNGIRRREFCAGSGQNKIRALGKKSSCCPPSNGGAPADAASNCAARHSPSAVPPTLKLPATNTT
jgi:hypothetical protein